MLDSNSLLIEKQIFDLMKEIHQLDQGRNERAMEKRLEIHKLIIQLPYEKGYCIMKQATSSLEEFNDTFGRLRESILAYQSGKIDHAYELIKKHYEELSLKNLEL